MRETPQQNTPTAGKKQKVVIEKRKKESKKNDAQEKIGNKRERKRERRMQSIESPKVPKNNAQ